MFNGHNVSSTKKACVSTCQQLSRQLSGPTALVRHLSGTCQALVRHLSVLVSTCQYLSAPVSMCHEI